MKTAVSLSLATDLFGNSFSEEICLLLAFSHLGFSWFCPLLKLPSMSMSEAFS